MDLHDRRRLIAVHDNPDVRADYLVALGGEISLGAAAQPVAVAFRYVPDRHVIRAEAWVRYLEAVAGSTPASLEDAATMILTDVSDVVIPRWCALEVSAQLPGTGRQKVTVVDRQPEWNDTEGLIMFDRMGETAE